MAKQQAGAGDRLIRLPFPIKGTDQGWALGDQPPLTTPNLLNVRALDWRQRQGGGKRAGTAKAFMNIAGESMARRINGMGVLNRARAAPGSSVGSFETLDDSFTVPGVAAPADIGTDWHCFEESGITGSGPNYDVDIETLGGAKRLVFNPTTGVGDYFGAAIAYATTNDITVTIRGDGNFSTTNANNGASGETAGVGPFVRGSNRLQNCIGCRLRRNGATSAIIDIVSVTGNVVAILASSSAITTSSPGTTANDLSIRLVDTGAAVVATVNWPTQDSGGSWTNVVVSHTISTFSGNTRAGVAMMGVASWTTFASGHRAVVRVQAIKIVPPSPTVVHQLLGTTTTSPAPLRYFIPDGWTGTNIETNGTQTNVVGFANQSTTPSDNVPRVDTSNDELTGCDTNPDDRTGFLIRTGDVTNYGVEVRHLSDHVTTDKSDRIDFVTRVASDFKSGIVTTLPNGAGSTNRGASEMMGCSNNQFIKFVNGAKTTLESINESWCWRAGNYVRCVDDANTISIYVNGMLMQSYVAGTVTGVAGTGVGAFPVDINTTYGGFGFRLIESEAISATDVGEVDSTVVVCTTGYVDAGRISAGSLSRCTGVGLYNPVVQFASFAAKFYAVDGVASKIIDPDALTVEDYTATNGTAPTGCRLICLYRGRVFQARQSSNPAIWFCARVGFPRDYDYLNSNGNGGTSTAANYGTNADVGVPGDSITALIPFSDDYLYFGCGSSVWMLEGDPGYGGAIQNVSYRTGIVGPRAFAFDDNGNLYFMGAAGIYRIERGAKNPINITGRRLILLLDSVNFSTTFCQLAWDASGGYLHIFLTPTDGTTAGTHCVYDPSTPEGGGWWLDKYPADFGPWAVAEINGVADEDRRIIIGGNDGYVRRPVDGTFTDDGTAIDSWVEIGPFQLDGGSVYSMVTELQAMIGAGSESVTWYWFTGDSPEEVASQTFGSEVASGTWTNTGSIDGFQPPVGLRQTGGAHKIRIRQNTASVTGRWSIEQIRATLMPTGRRRL